MLGFPEDVSGKSEAEHGRLWARASGAGARAHFLCAPSSASQGRYSADRTCCHQIFAQIGYMVNAFVVGYQWEMFGYTYVQTCQKSRRIGSEILHW